MMQARIAIISLCLSSIKSLGALFAALLAGGSVSGEIERGVLAVILPKPIPRWQILLGKWLGLNIILVVSVLFWTFLTWLSFRQQTDIDVSGLLRAGPYLSLYPVLLCTLTLSISAVAPRLLGTTAALILAAFAWFDGILNALGYLYDVDLLHTVANLGSLVLPQGTVAWWVERATQDLIIQDPRRSIGNSPEFVREWGQAHLHFAHLDAVYVVVYIAAVFIIGAVLFERRDI